MDSKGFWIVIAVLVVIFGGVILFRGNSGNEPNLAGGNPTSHLIGDNAKGVTLVEYGDYQCPICGQYYPVIKQVVQKYQADISFQYRNLPLSNIHQNAFGAARAAEAADKQGKFWEMHDLLFQGQTAWSGSQNATATFEGYAQQLGLDLEKFKADFASTEVNDAINADITAFKETGENLATPTFFLNGTKIKPTTLEEFSELIDAEIAKQSISGQTSESQPSS